MFQVIRHSASLAKGSLTRPVPAFSTCVPRWSTDPSSVNEAPKIDNDAVLALPQEAREKTALESTIVVPEKGKMDSNIDTPRSPRLPSRARLMQSRGRRWRLATVNLPQRTLWTATAERENSLNTDVVTTAGADDEGLSQMTRTKKDRGSQGDAQEGPTVEDVIKHVTSIVI